MLLDSLSQALSDRFGSRFITSEAARAQYAQSEGYHVHEPPSAVVQPVTIEDVQYLVGQAADNEMRIVA